MCQVPSREGAEQGHCQLNPHTSQDTPTRAVIVGPPYTEAHTQWFVGDTDTHTEVCVTLTHACFTCCTHSL